MPMSAKTGQEFIENAIYQNCCSKAWWTCHSLVVACAISAVNYCWTV